MIFCPPKRSMMPDKRAVVDDPPLGDDHHPAAERHHVLHVMARQQDRHLADLLVVLAGRFGCCAGRSRPGRSSARRETARRASAAGRRSTPSSSARPATARGPAGRADPPHAEHVGQLVAGAVELLAARCGRSAGAGGTIRRRAGPTKAGSSGPSPGRTGGDRRFPASRARGPSRGRCPRVGVITPESSLSVVVLPAPLGPRKATNSPCFDAQIDAADRLDQRGTVGGTARESAAASPSFF